MAIDISVLEDLGVLKVTYSPEDVTRKGLAEQRNLVADAISKSAISNVLVDASALAQLPPILTIFEHNVTVSLQDTLRKAKFAVVCGSYGENEQFLEITGLNRGVQIRCFTSQDSALSWLIGQPDKCVEQTRRTV